MKKIITVLSILMALVVGLVATAAAATNDEIKVYVDGYDIQVSGTDSYKIYYLDETGACISSDDLYEGCRFIIKMTGLSEDVNFDGKDVFTVSPQDGKVNIISSLPVYRTAKAEEPVTEPTTEAPTEPVTEEPTQPEEPEPTTEEPTTEVPVVTEEPEEVPTEPETETQTEPEEPETEIEEPTTGSEPIPYVEPETEPQTEPEEPTTTPDVPEVIETTPTDTEPVPTPSEPEEEEPVTEIEEPITISEPEPEVVVETTLSDHEPEVVVDIPATGSDAVPEIPSKTIVIPEIKLSTIELPDVNIPDVNLGEIKLPQLVKEEKVVEEKETPVAEEKVAGNTDAIPAVEAAPVVEEIPHTGSSSAGIAAFATLSVAAAAAFVSKKRVF